MTRIPDLLQQGRCYSFEFFPPRTPEAEATLEATLVELEPLQPSYVSVTYGAGGSTRERTHDLVVRINEHHALCAMAHLTCVGHTRAELTDIVTRYGHSGVDNILALGGDPPAGVELAPGELEYAIELVRLIRGVGEFAVGVAAHPEPHPRSTDVESDRRHTAEKLAEADFAVTQFFFEPHHYFELVASLHAHGVDKPVIPGIMPVTSISAIARMAKMQGSEFPEWLSDKLHEVEDDPAAVRAIGIDEATKLCQTLLDGGAPGLHFYTMNQAGLTTTIWQRLGL